MQVDPDGAVDNNMDNMHQPELCKLIKTVEKFKIKIGTDMAFRRYTYFLSSKLTHYQLIDNCLTTQYILNEF